MDGANQKILIACEDRNDLQELQTILSHANYHVIPATSGGSAIASYVSYLPDFIILDVQYADMSGLDVAKKIQAHIVDKFVPVIFISNSLDNNIAFCYEVGDEVIIKPFNTVRILGKLKALSRAERRNVLTRTERDELALYQSKLIQEQEIAKKIFDSIAHSGCLSDPLIRYKVSPMALFNGDVVLAAKNPVGDLYLFVGDFTGHGLAAAMGAVPISEIFYGMVHKGFELNDIIAKMNEKLKAVLPGHIFCACACAVFNMRNNTLKVFSGGFPPIFVKRHDKSKSDLMIYSNNLPLGILVANAFDIEVMTYELSENDKIILYTDGLNEAKNQKKDIFGSRRLQEIFKNNSDPNRLFDEILSQLNQFTQGIGLNDDCTIIEYTAKKHIHNKETENKSAPIVCFPNFVALDWQVEFSFGLRTLQYQNALPVIMHWVGEYPILKPDYQSLYNIIEELFNNALDHGILKIGDILKQRDGKDFNLLRKEYLAKAESGSIKVNMKILTEEAKSLIVIEIEDSGEGFDHVAVLANAHENIGEYGGIQRILHYCDSITYNQKGNVVTVVYRSCSL